MAEEAALPTYRTAASVLEAKNGSGIRLVGWTALRTLMIAPPMLLVGVPARQAFAGAGLASGFISLFTLLRIFDAQKTGLGGARAPRYSRYTVRVSSSRKGKSGSLCVSAPTRKDAKDIVSGNLKKGQRVTRVDSGC